MELPLSLKFEGWNMKYGILSSQTTSAQASKAKWVVFVHGTPWSSIVFKPTIEALLAKDSYKILAYDLPGYGHSLSHEPGADLNAANNGFPGDTSVRFQARALAKLLSHLKIDGKEDHAAPAIIAHDIAGTIVLRAHLLHNCEFDTMMLVDTNCILPWGDGFYKLARSEPQTFLKLPPAIFEAVLRAVIRSAVHDPKVLQTGLGWEDALAKPWLQGQDGLEGQWDFIRQIAQANDGDVAEMLEADLYGKVRCDVKIVWGERDQWIPRE